MDEVTRILIFSVIFTLSAVILLLFSFTINRRRHIQHKKQLLEQEYKTREEALLHISRDLHDEIGSSLSGINLLTQLAMQQATPANGAGIQLLQKINKYTNEVIEKVSDMAWLIKPSQESLSILINKLKGYSLSTATAKNILMDFSYDPESSGKELSIHQRKAIYLISKEAINNAIKYSDCKNIYCNFDLNASPQQVLIRDDGNGFCIKKNMDGNGLKNMEARAEEINATIKITSVPGNGTTIELEL